MPQYDLAYDLSAFNWRDVTGSDNDYRLVKNGNALSWKRKNALATGDLVVDSYDTDTSAIYHRAITGGVSYTAQATWTNGTHGTFEYGNGFNGILCWNRNFTLTGTSPTNADNPSGTIWRLRATGVTGANATTAATGITGTASGLQLDSGGFGGYQACLNFGTAQWNATFGAAHTNSASAWTNAIWILEKQNAGPPPPTPPQATWNMGAKATAGNGEWDDMDTPGTATPVASWNAGALVGVRTADDEAFYSSIGVLAVNRDAKTGTVPPNNGGNFTGNYTLRRADNSATITGAANFSVQTLTGLAPNDPDNTAITITSQAAMANAFAATPVASGPDWVLEIPGGGTITALNAFTYASPNTGSIPTDTSGQWELELSGNSNSALNTKVAGSLTLNTTNNTILVGTLAAMRTAWGSGVDLNSGGGTWTLRKIS